MRKETRPLKTKVISAFPACGKTWMYEHQKELGLSILDSDSSEFSWIRRPRTLEEIQVIEAIHGSNYVNAIREELIKDRNPEFPTNYINYIKEQIESKEYDYIFVSSHESVRKALNEAGINFTVVYPHKRCKVEWVGRCYLRELEGKKLFPIKVLIDNWDQWIKQLMSEVNNHHECIILEHGEYLSDAYNKDFI